MPSSDSVNSPVGSSSIRVTSTSFRLAAAVWVIRESSRLRGLWMPGVIQRHILYRPLGDNAGNTVAGRFVPFGSDGNFCNQVVGQAGFAHVGAAHRATNTLEGISGSLWFFCIRTFSFNLLQSAGYLARLGSPVLHGWAAGPYFSSVLFSFGVLTCSCLPRR